MSGGAAFFGIALALLTGCATPQSRAKERLEAFAALPRQMQTAVLRGDLMKGMDSDAVYIALGQPDRVVREAEKAAKVELWIYKDASTIELPAWRDLHESSGGAGTVSHHHYDPIRFTRLKDAFEVKFVEGKVDAWRFISGSKTE